MPGLYWRLEEGGLLFGWSDPDELPGEARAIDWPFYERMRERLAGFVPVTRDLGLRKDLGGHHRLHARPPADPRARPRRRRRAIEGVTVASAGGHGMMWGPARRPGRRRPRSSTGRTDLIDVTDLGLDRFDADGRSRLAADPIALPFPLIADDEAVGAGTTAG